MSILINKGLLLVEQQGGLHLKTFCPITCPNQEAESTSAVEVKIVETISLLYHDVHISINVEIEVNTSIINIAVSTTSSTRYLQESAREADRLLRRIDEVERLSEMLETL
ncbi:hypothetical protein ONZ51_g7824 [Trametes cubensis]|uniref:Uncharacterized protein n=1 Tax=Trametes cubensis TaxID=1111947 RepID=A0AAD7TPV8_9APHY|nr:hypothetical protein ONZ51_g7824 [Trametes cubensis]